MRSVVISRPLDAASPIEALVLAHPSLNGRTLELNLAHGKLTALSQWSGSTGAIDAVVERYVRARPDHVDHAEIVERSGHGLLLFVTTDCGRHPLDIAGAIEAVLGPETLLQLSYTARGVTWRIATTNPGRLPFLMERIGERYSAIEASLARSVTPYRVLSATGELDEDEDALTAVQQMVWETAAREGYFERPRGCTLDDLAGACEMPRSTVHYHLREAQRKVNRRAARFV